MSIMRSMLSIIIAAIVLVILVALAPTQHFKVQGLFLPGQHHFPANTSGTVALYQYAPTHYQQVGRINLQLHYNPNKSASFFEQQIITKAKHIAAQHGATGIIVKLFAHTETGMISAAQAKYIFKGVAIITS